MSFNIDRIASLANITLNEEEKQTVKTKMEGILNFVASITELDLGNHTANISSYELATVLREDIVGTTLTPEELAKNIPKLDNYSIIVPQVIQK
ncbi:MAG: Asp-tRNA(Asn)/Glu-tRNA(Gln) amidotransferase subunit GatC [Spirochaetota bacterium]|nr:Asp-tRNA(Asn)/Glu-tRNA(Gln) amidotransferase subunit GatC [Spirochaetota bacterium]